MQQNNSQAARKSHKLESLPDDLRSVADELIAAKFPEPEVSVEITKKSSQPTYTSWTSNGSDLWNGKWTSISTVSTY